MVELRNTLIHSCFSESLIIPEYRNTNLIGYKNVKTSKGFEHRLFTVPLSFLEGVNKMILDLQMSVRTVQHSLTIGDFADSRKEMKSNLKKMEKIDFKIPPFREA